MAPLESFTLTSTSEKEFRTMIRTYSAHVAKRSEYDEKKEVRCVWFPIEQVNNIAKRLKREGADGLRVYFGRYPTDVGDFEDPKPLPDTNTVIFISTKKNEKGEHEDYFTGEPMIPENRGEQCQPNCGGTST